MLEVLLTIYIAALAFIFIYSLVQLNLVFNYFKQKRLAPVPNEDPAVSNYPFVTVQLPVYNERYVVERLIECVAKFDYPTDKFEIQVLDDSTDESLLIAKKKIEEVVSRGINISQICRKDRVGFKAGALAEGLKTAKGEFITIFDADFLPPVDFLKKTVHQFNDPEIGCVQTSWKHINKNYSLLTKMQAFGLDAHFSVEQVGRNSGGHFMNFNGTAGIWRKQCIIDAGGWQPDTLTEDLDLSYRAQLKGWKFKYLENVGAPAELPAVMNALKSQQFRWNKGAAETARKHLGKILKSNKLPFSTKIHATFHLLNSGVFLCIVIVSLLSIPVLYAKHQSETYQLFFKLAPVFLISLLILGAFYWIPSRREHHCKLKAASYFLLNFPLFLSISMGLSLHNAIAVFEGYIGKKSPFIRTPKFNIQVQEDTWSGNLYLSRKFGFLPLLEGVMALYFISGIFLAFKLNDFGLVPFHVMLATGFGTVFYYSVRHSFK